MEVSKFNIENVFKQKDEQNKSIINSKIKLEGYKDI